MVSLEKGQAGFGGQWSGHQIIQYWLSDVRKTKHAVAVMIADVLESIATGMTVRIIDSKNQCIL
jgi:hypothetical protein